MRSEIAITVGARVFGIAAGLVTSVLTARYLGVEGRGLYFLIIVASQFVVQFASLGLSTSNTYLVVKQPEHAAKLLANSLWISVAGGLAFSAIVLPFFSPNWGEDGLAWVFAPVIGVLSLAFMLVSNLLIGLGRVTAYNGFQILNFSLILVLYVVAVLADLGLVALLGASAAAAAISTAAAARVALKGRLLEPYFDKRIFQRGFAYAMRAYIATLLGYLVLRTVVALMSHRLGKAEIGEFSIAAQIGDTLALLPQSIALVLFPKLVGAQKDLWKSLFKMSGIVATIMLVLCGIAYVVAGPLIILLFGNEFSNAAVVTYWMLPSVFFLGVINTVSQYFAAAGFPWSVVSIWFVGLIVTVGTAWVLLPHRGTIGAAIALGVGHFVVLCLMTIAALFRSRTISEEQRCQ